MDSSILNAIFRDPVLNRLTAGETSTTKASLPENVVAKVASLKGEIATLRWQGGSFTATLNASVNASETLLLKYSGLKEGRSHYKIMARFPAGSESVTGSVKDSSEPILFGLMTQQTEKENPAPALVKLLPRKKQGADSEEAKDPLIELFIDTESFGLVLVRFYYYKDDRLECHFIVETREAGQALQFEADALVTEAGGNIDGENSEPLRWTVGNLRKTAAETLSQGGLNLNARA